MQTLAPPSSISPRFGVSAERTPIRTSAEAAAAANAQVMKKFIVFMISSP
jgi:hypothetical protein